MYKSTNHYLSSKFFAIISLFINDVFGVVHKLRTALGEGDEPVLEEGGRLR